MPRLPPQEGLPPPLCIPPLPFSVDALYVVNRTFHLLIKPDNLTCYQHTSPNLPRTEPVTAHHPEIPVSREELPLTVFGTREKLPYFAHQK